MKKFFAKVGAFFTNNKKMLLSFLWILCGVVAVSVATALILVACDIIGFDGGDMYFNLELFNSFKGEWYGFIFFILLQIVLSMLLCVFPGVSMAFIILSQTVLYPIAWQSFLLCFVSVAVASFSMYLIGRFGGYRLCVRMIGKEDCERALGLLRDKGTFFFPFMMLFPFFPDEALTMVAGTVKMKLSWFIPSILVARGIGIATITFGLSAIPFDKFTTPWHWIGFAAVIALVVAAVLFGAKKFNAYMECRRTASEAEPDATVSE